MSTCDEVGSDMHALIKERAIRRVDHRPETHSNESQHLAQGTEVERLRQRFSFVLQQALSFRTRRRLCRQGMALAGTLQLHSQGPVSVHAHRTERVTGSEERERANRVGGGSGVGGRIRDGNGVGGRDGDVIGDRDGDGAGTKKGVEVNEGTQEENGDGSGYGNESSSEDENGDEDGNEDENEDGTRKGGEEVKKRKKPHKSRRRDALLFRTRHHLCRQGVALAGTQQLLSRGPVSVLAHRSEGVTGSKEWEDAKGSGA